MTAVSTPLRPEVPFLDTLTPGPDPVAGTGGVPGWLDDLHARGLAVYRSHGLPGPKSEAWKYTRLAGLAKTPFVGGDPLGGDPPVGPGLQDGSTPAPTPTTASALAAVSAAAALDLPQSAPRVVLVNGVPVAALSTPADRLPAGLQVASLRATLAEAPDSLRGLLGGQLSLDGSLPLAALNTGAFVDGLVVRVLPGVTVDQPLHVIAIATGLPGPGGTGGGDRPALCHPRHLVLIGEGARATVVESQIGTGTAPTLTNQVMECAIGAGAHLAHVRLLNGAAEDAWIGATVADVAAGGHLEAFALALGGATMRNELWVTLAGAGARAHFAGAYGLEGRQHLDTTVVVDHAVGETTSRQSLKGVLDGGSRAVFQGKILVRPDAQKTDGQQVHRALMLSEGAEVDTKPELEIYADDVICGHGATVGDIDADQIFYLQSRGLDADTARGLLVEAFLDEVIAEVADPGLRAALVARVRDWQRRRRQAVWSD